MKRSTKLAKNTFYSLFLQVVVILSSFIIPKLILVFYGSEVNGLVNSITQFLQIIAFLELGVGAVVQSALYKPLYENNYRELSCIILSANKFFRKIGLVLAIYVFVLIMTYPFISNQRFSFIYTAVLIFAIGISSFSRYYFGIVDQILLTADQRGYIYYTSVIITIVVNTFLCSLLILLGFSIQFVKLFSAAVYLTRPLLLKLYIIKNYKIDKHIKYYTEPIKQKWNGISQHISGVVLDHADIIILTVFSTLTSVSIYSVYHMVVFGIKTLFTSLTNGVQALLGNIYAKSDNKQLQNAFDWMEWCIHTGVVFFFGCTLVLILPFVQTYTKGISDADYYQPIFAVTIVLAHAIHCLRLPYQIMIKAGGFYRETQNSYTVAAILNVVVSILFVKLFGLIGVSIGTLIAMIYQTSWMSLYNSNHLIRRPFNIFLKQIFVDIISIVACIILTLWIHVTSLNYMSWAFSGMETVIVFILTLLCLNYIFYRQKTVFLVNETLRRLFNYDSRHF